MASLFHLPVGLSEYTAVYDALTSCPAEQATANLTMLLKVESLILKLLSGMITNKIVWQFNSGI